MEKGGVSMIKPCYVEIEEKLKGVDCVLAFETASDYLGTNCMTHQRPSFCVYSTKELNMEGVECTVVDSYDNIEIIEERGIRCTSVTQTLIDLLRYDRDDQVILESIANWYFKHSESFEGLSLPDDVKPIFDSYADDAIHYYDEV